MYSTGSDLKNTPASVSLVAPIDWPTFSGSGDHSPSSYEGFSGNYGDVSTSEGGPRRSLHRGLESEHRARAQPGVVPLHGTYTKQGSLLEEIQKLRKENYNLESELNTVRGLLYQCLSLNFTAQMRTLGSPYSPSNTHLSRTAFPAVRFWYKDDWLDHENEKKEKRTGVSVNNTLHYVEDRNGVPVSCNRAQEIRLFAKFVWDQFAEAGKDPKSWEVVDKSVAEDYHFQMRQRFPEFALCDGVWKSQLLASETYPNWRKEERKKSEPVSKTQSNTPSSNNVSNSASTASSSQDMIIRPGSSLGSFTNFKTQQFINSSTFRMDPVAIRGASAGDPRDTSMFVPPMEGGTAEVQLRATNYAAPFGVDGFVAEWVQHTAEFQPNFSVVEER